MGKYDKFLGQYREKDKSAAGVTDYNDLTNRPSTYLVGTELAPINMDTLITPGIFYISGWTTFAGTSADDGGPTPILIINNVGGIDSIDQIISISPIFVFQRSWTISTSEWSEPSGGPLLDITTFINALNGYVPISRNITINGTTQTLGSDANFTIAGGAVEDSIVDGHTTVAPSGNAVFDALVLKAPLVSPTFTGTVALGTSPTMTTPVITGLPTGTGVSSVATASTLAARNSFGNVLAANFIEGFRTQVTAAGITTLGVGDGYQQVFTGSTTQTVKLPTTGVVAGQSYIIINSSTGIITVQSSGANTIITLAGGTFATFTALVATPTTAANWNYQYQGMNTASGKKATVNNNLTLAGTDATTMTFPTTNATIARTDAAQTFTGVQTMSSKMVTAGNSEVAKTYTPASGAQTVALDCLANNIHEVTGNASGTAITFTIANVTNSQCFVVAITQGAVASTVAGRFATIRRDGGSAPTLPAATKRITLGFRRTGANTYDGFIIGASN